MKSIIFVIPYFGKLPVNFKLWLTSVEYNKTVDFLLITDDKTKYNYPKNVKVIYSNFHNVQEKIKNIFGETACIKNAYKLCDYRPFYNIIFKDEVNKYDFWGYCDIDLIFGNIRKFLTDKILCNYNKIYTRGHMTLFKNDARICKNIKNSEIRRDCYNWQEMICTNYACHFDEWGGISKIFKYLNVEQYDLIDFADVNVDNYCFYRNFVEKYPGIFEWEDGTLYFVNKKLEKIEVIYAHFQKRRMSVEVNNCEKFYIIPNKYINTNEEITEDFVKKNIKNRKLFYIFKLIKMRKNIIIFNFQNGAIGQRFYRMKKKYLNKN